MIAFIYSLVIAGNIKWQDNRSNTEKLSNYSFNKIYHSSDWMQCNYLNWEHESLRFISVIQKVSENHENAAVWFLNSFWSFWQENPCHVFDCGVVSFVMHKVRWKLQFEISKKVAKTLILTVITLWIYSRWSFFQLR